MMEGFGQTQTIVDSPAEADHCMVVDVSNLAYRSAFAYALTVDNTPTGKPSGHVYGSVRLLLSTLKNSMGPGKWCIVLCYDGLEAKAARREIMPEYKGGRDDGRFNPIPEVAEVLKYVPGLHIIAADKEGDDGMAWAAWHIHQNTKCGVTLLTGDRDLWAMTALERVRVFSPNLAKKKNEDGFVRLDHILKEYHVKKPAKIYLAKALFGDASDGIRGVDRLQKKKIAPYMNIQGVSTPDQLYDQLEKGDWEGLTMKAKIKLQDAKEQVKRNFAVIRPRVDGFGADTMTRTKSTSTNKDSLQKALLEYNCVALAEQLMPLYGEAQYVKVKE